LTCVAVAVLLSAGMLAGQSKAKATNVDEIPFQSVPDFIKLPPDLYLGESMGVATVYKEHFDLLELCDSLGFDAICFNER
jgi:hypothetical protein